MMRKLIFPIVILFFTSCSTEKQVVIEKTSEVKVESSKVAKSSTQSVRIPKN